MPIHDVKEWKECPKCGKDYPITWHLNHCILHLPKTALVMKTSSCQCSDEEKGETS